MPGQLGLSEAEVHAKARAVLDYWFEELGPDRHFAKDAAVDQTIRERFGPLRDLVLGSGAAGWRDDPETLMAAKPGLIWAGISALGPAFPDAPGYDPVLQAMSGYMELTGDAEGPGAVAAFLL